MRTIGRVLLYCVYLILIIFFSLEIMVRLLGYADRYYYDPIYQPGEQTDKIPFVLKPNLENARAHGKIRINTDELGLRSAAPGEKYRDKERHEYRIAFMGDSVTFGVGVSFQDTYPHIIENMLNSMQHGCKVKVFNFAVSSYSVKEMAATLRYRVPPVKPDLVVMAVVYGDFDVHRTPGVDKWGYNTHRDASELINRLPTIKMILRNIHLSYVIRDVIIRYREWQAVQTIMDGLPEWAAQSYHYVTDFRDIADRAGYRYLVVTLPSIEGDGSQFREIIARFKRDGVHYLDVSQITHYFSSKDFRASTYDWHPAGVVHRKMADIVGKYIYGNYVKEACNKNNR